MTGTKTADASPHEGARFTAGAGYITGTNVKLEPGKRIVQTWRTTEFQDSDPDSQIVVLLEPVAGGTKLTLHHTNVPDGHTGYEHGGWQDNYFAPMKRYFRK
ncbi:MAG: SRPBCC domain-containing protein [Aggregatilineales bacterium]